MPNEQPPEVTPPAIVPVDPPPVAPVEPEYRWYHKASAVVFITFCLDIGLFLLIFPWTDYWDFFGAYLAAHATAWHSLVDSMYARGAISGIGVVNLYISLGEVFGLRRFSKH